MIFSPESICQRDEIVNRIVDFTKKQIPIKLPRSQDLGGAAPSRFALFAVADQPNDFRGEINDYVYQFEGEDDLLHLMILRKDQSPASIEDSQKIAQFIFRGIPPALIWYKPGEFSQHYYLGHDDLVAFVQLSSK